MSLMERVVGIVANAAGNYVNPAVTGLLSLAAAVTGRAELLALAVPAGAVAGAVTEDLVANARRIWVGDGIGQFADAVESAAGMPIDELTKTVADRGVLVLLAESVAAATEAPHDEWKLGALARAFVTGFRDPARVDEQRLLVETLRDVEAADVRLLAAVYRLERANQGISNPRMVNEGNLKTEDSGLRDVVPLLAARLVKGGLLAAEPDPLSAWPRDQQWRLTGLGWRCSELLGGIGALPARS